jgi:hypothetical protein
VNPPERALAARPPPRRCSIRFITGETFMGTHDPRRPAVGTAILAIVFAAGLAAAAPGLAASARDPDARCRRLEARIAQLQTRLRMGYTARQGRLWRQQLAALEAERRATCR